MRPENQEIELLEPALFRFENVNDEIVGTLEAVETLTIEGKPATRYTINADEGDFYVLATVDLAKKLRKRHEGLRVRIRYEGEKRIPGVSRPVRDFKVTLASNRTDRQSEQSESAAGPF